MRKCLYLIFFFINICRLQAQQLEIKNAESLSYDEAIRENAQILVGNVIISNGSVTVRSDSAFFYELTNKVEAFGNITIEKPGEITATCRHLLYDGNTKETILEDQVVLTNAKSQIKTPRLFYNTQTQLGSYFEGAVITQKNEQLTSKIGYYNGLTQMYFFRKAVKVNSTDFQLTADTLQYNSEEEKAYFFGKAKIISGKSTTLCESGWYLIPTKESYLMNNVVLWNEQGQKVVTDTLRYNDIKQKGYTKGITALLDTNEQIELYGADFAFSKSAKGLKIDTQPFIIQYTTSDTLMLIADTVERSTNSADKVTLKAWKNAKSVSKELIFTTDSLVYTEIDSQYQLYYAPTAWSYGYQINADTLLIDLIDKQPAHLHLRKQAFVLKPLDSTRFDQISGRNMLGKLKDRKLLWLKVFGNAASIFNVTEDNDSSKLIGVNSIQSANMEIRFEDGKPTSVGNFGQPKGSLLPPKNADPKAMLLPQFKYMPEGLNNIKQAVLERFKYYAPWKARLHSVM